MVWAHLIQALCLTNRGSEQSLLFPEKDKWSQEHQPCRDKTWTWHSLVQSWIPQLWHGSVTWEGPRPFWAFNFLISVMGTTITKCTGVLQRWEMNTNQAVVSIGGSAMTFPTIFYFSCRQVLRARQGERGRRWKGGHPKNNVSGLRKEGFARLPLGTLLV